MKTTQFTQKELEELVKSENYEDRIKAAKQGYRLDVLVYDEDCYLFLPIAHCIDKCNIYAIMRI